MEAPRPADAGSPGHPRPEAVDDRKWIDALFWMSKTRLPWRDLPPAFGKWRSVHDRFVTWTRTGRWTRLFELIGHREDLLAAFVDSTFFKAAPCAAGAQKKQGPAQSRSRQKLGQSRGGLTTKLHAAVDEEGRLAAAFITSGQASDAVRNGPRIARMSLALEAKGICADKAYDTDEIVDLCARANAEAVIPSKANRTVQRSHDAEKYKRRNVVERFFRRLREHRRLCLMTDKLAPVFMSWAWLAAIKDWLAPGE